MINTETNKCNVLVASPVRQKADILKEFLNSLSNLEQTKINLDFCFVDDNDDATSSDLLQTFANKQTKSKCTIIKFDNINNKNSHYTCNENTHYWNEHLIWKVAAIKDKIIETALEQEYDYLFLIDSDLLINPKTINCLIDANKDIISEVFWTKWTPDGPLQPQVWISDFYNLTEEFVNQIKKPGVYPVGGLGACTLISKKAIQCGISFKKINNITFWGEDRHFCIRAMSLGLELFVDTHYPAYHIYRDSDLAGVNQFKKENNIKYNKLTLSMCLGNEADKYLIPMMTSASKYIDEAVIIDDASSDNSVEICKSILKGIPCHIIRNEKSKFSNEIELRKQQWEETIKTNPDWIIFLDADQIFEDKFKDIVSSLMHQTEYDAFYFRLYDFWDENHYRDDTFWCAHNFYRPFLIRYKNDFKAEWRNQPQHCGSMPCNIIYLNGMKSDIRLKHYGWAKKEDRINKYDRYMKLDPGAVYGIAEQYESILDENPKLVEWQE